MSLKLGVDQVVKLSERRFERRLIKILEASDPSARALGDPPALETLRKQCAKARAYGMNAELDVARYVITAWLLGPDFDTCFAAMAEILGAAQLSPTQKADAIERVCGAVIGGLQEGRA